MVDIANNFQGGNITQYLRNWENMTSDPVILNIVRYGLKLDLISLPLYHRHYSQHSLSSQEITIIKKEINKLLSKTVITKSIKLPSDFISGVFTRDKKDGSKRMILNLKKLNTYIKYNHFKMEYIQNVIDIVRPGVYIDLWT